MKNNDVKNKRVPKTLAEFAFKQQAPMDAAGNMALNAVVTWFLLTGSTIVPVISPPGSVFAKSLLGTLVPPAVIIAFVISIVTTRTAIKKRIKGEVLPPFKEGTPWLGNALKWGLIRAIINILVAYGVGGIIIQFDADAHVSRAAAAVIVGLIAGGLAYLESATAVLRTAK